MKASSFTNQFIALTKKEIKIQFRYPVNILSLFLMNFLIIGVFVIVLKLFLDPSNASGGSLNLNSVSTFMFWGFFSFNVFNDAMFSIGTSMRLEQQTGTLETLFLYPINHLANLLSKIFFGFIINVLVGITGFFLIQALIGTIITGFPEIILTVFLFLLLIIQMYGMAFFIAGLSIKLKESILPLVNFSQFFLLISSGFFTPFAVLGSLVLFSFGTPFSYTIDLLRSTIFNSDPELAVIFVTSVLSDISLIPTIIQLQWILVIILTFFLPIVGYKYYIHAIDKGREKGDLTDY